MTALADRRSSAALRLVTAGPAPARPAAAPTRGELSLGFAVRAGRTRLAQTYQAGCLRVRAPRFDAADGAQAVLINVGGGVVGGDRLVQAVHWGAGARATVASQAAEKVYRSLGPVAQIATRLDVETGADAEWLPQETIIFDRARLERRIEVSLAPGARFLGVECIVLGRTAMGETVSQASLRDSWRIRRDGRLIYADVQKLDGAVDRLMARPAIGAGARAMGVAIHASDGAAGLLPGVREALAGARGRAAASAWNGLLVVRLLACDGQTLRHDLMLAMAALRAGAAPPRVWSC